MKRVRVQSLKAGQVAVYSHANRTVKFMVLSKKIYLCVIGIIEPRDWRGYCLAEGIDFTFTNWHDKIQVIHNASTVEIN